jgi:5'(3')-deoxyribonucleotidase
MLLVDLDGLGANFKAGLAAHIPWSDFSAMSETAQHEFLMKVFATDPHFFGKLPVIEQFAELIQHIESTGERWMICTSAGEAHPSYMTVKQDKLDWLERKFGIPANKVIVTPNSEAKLNYANAHTILIDDWRVNCERFKEAGGLSVHVKANEYNVVEVCNAIDKAIEQMHLLEIPA